MRLPIVRPAPPLDPEGRALQPLLVEPVIPCVRPCPSALRGPSPRRQRVRPFGKREDERPQPDGAHAPQAVEEAALEDAVGPFPEVSDVEPDAEGAEVGEGG